MPMPELTIWFDAVKTKPVREGWYEFITCGSLMMLGGEMREFRGGKWRSKSGGAFNTYWGDKWRGIAGGFQHREGDPANADSVRSVWEV